MARDPTPPRKRRTTKASKTHGTWFWHELLTSDVRKAKSFYGKLFGWTTQPMKMPGMTYTMWKRGRSMHGGMMDSKNAGGAPPHWMTYVQVDDVDASAKRVARLGGKVVAKPFDIPGVGRICVIADPTGAMISMIQPSG